MENKQKHLNINKTVYELVTVYPELKDILFELGFKDIVKPVMLTTVGKIMTIKKGALMRGVDLDQIITKLQQYDFIVMEE